MTDIDAKKKEKTGIEAETDKSEGEGVPELTNEQMRAAALAYARLLKEKGLKPGEAVFGEPAEEEAEPAEEPAEAKAADEEEPAASKDTDASAVAEETPADTEAQPADEEQKQGQDPNENKGSGDGKKKETAEEKKKEAAENKKKEAAEKRRRAEAEKKEKYKERYLRGGKKNALASVTDLHDRAQDSTDRFFGAIGRDIVRAAHKVGDSYKNSRRSIGIAILIIGVVAAVILWVFDKYTVYEYAYNGKVLGYVQEQEEITDVLEVAGRKLSDNNRDGIEVEFVANQNVTFNLVDGRGKSTDDADTAINKLIYMTDIETEAYAIYDGETVVAVVKDSDEAEALLNQTKEALSEPDSGMRVVSSEFTNDLDVKPVNVLLGSVQSNAVAQDQMVNGGEMKTFHIVEEGETVESLAAEFGVDDINIYNEDNSEVAEDIEQGDRVCIRSTVEPVSVKLVETGKMKETIRYETIKKESDEYYKGDTQLEQDGVDGRQIFEGTITKIGGKIARRDAKSIEVTREKQDKIILVGTKERPKTAPTGTYLMPINNYVVTSEFGFRWGRLHSGIDLGSPTGTPIYASDGGTVIRAEYYGGYGNCIDIDHGNGRVTRYGHCSKLLVNRGDLVYQGQEIGLVGSTGNSTGSHLHFEVILNGTAQNPRNFINP